MSFHVLSETFVNKLRLLESLSRLRGTKGKIIRMSNSNQQTLAVDHRPSDQNPNQSQEWETMARAWLSAFPEAKAVSTTEVEAWIESNRGSLPADLQSMPRADLIDRLLAIQNYMRLPNQATEVTQVDLPHARFQRTDQWLPVYSWLESLDNDEVVKSKDISDWLTENPEVKEQLCSRHTRYHLMHYIKKCHLKILKRRERKKGLQKTEKSTSPKVQKIVDAKAPSSLPIWWSWRRRFPLTSQSVRLCTNEAMMSFLPI
ncbi:uncharacterized protein LOC110632213 isoform X2 [Hevea brasiliensis]|uniref:uncharacterized protein LOC110632213 isoform X2 n=1 Tax=Hevea brasiliensis TaxID=3981 RepID=UPI0025DA9286|nr:uncharacterized protein LOC110632213 isoform X2 [Hevea brasiliensis]